MRPPLHGKGDKVPMNDSKEAKGVRLRGGDTYCRKCLERDEPWIWKHAKPDEYLYEDDLITELFFCDICGECIE